MGIEAARYCTLHSRILTAAGGSRGRESLRGGDQNPGIDSTPRRRRNCFETVFGAKIRATRARKHIVNDAAVAWHKIGERIAAPLCGHHAREPGYAP
jgi:hypothetical protein